ncbi:phage head closure protein [Loigolactobacillus backii]|uniref:phage head closure protein n=1 Tax=Loigolactobacillus backii TaxID=375175 RepID=UPI000C1CB3DC|nr:phage head closure protein [Loigolactobacillus backii]MDA5388781.1 phage head closure protein [Loigolactobacillus backii]MDA5391264.1 phage head closure protein [Loigolactobacillus backii]PIO83797.1 hypothetical protein BSQ39_09570 [Loigolactobacillus backii]
MKKYDLPRMKQRADFGTVKSVLNENTGNYVKQFVCQYSLWYGSFTKTITQSYAADGNLNLTDTVAIIIRHNPNINKSLEVRINDVAYSIVDINSDDQVNAFDVVIVKKIIK